MSKQHQEYSSTSSSSSSESEIKEVEVKKQKKPKKRQHAASKKAGTKKSYVDSNMVPQPSSSAAPPPPPLPQPSSSVAPPPPPQPQLATNTVSGKKRKHRVHIHPATLPKPPSSKEIFGTDDSENEDGQFDERPSGEAEAKRKRSKRVADHVSVPLLDHSTQQSTSSATVKKTTAREIFGSDSEDEVNGGQPPSGKKPICLMSNITRRVANGVARQTYEDKPGSHYVELKVYKCDEIDKIQPMNRWRHAIIYIKNRTDDNTEAWQALSNFISATRREFRTCPPTFLWAEIWSSQAIICIRGTSVMGSDRQEKWREINKARLAND